MDKNTGFLLSYIKYGDYDAILHCYTLESGFQSFFMRGIYSAKNKRKPFFRRLMSWELPFQVITATFQRLKR